MTALQWLTIAQSLVMIAATILLWSIRQAFKSGQAAADWQAQLSANKAAIERILETIDRARQKQSEMESTTTAKIGDLQLTLQSMRMELSLRVEQGERDHVRYDRELAALKDRQP